ncbi:unnamed protein product, partial [Staurois parvus]
MHWIKRAAAKIPLHSSRYLKLLVPLDATLDGPDGWSSGWLMDSHPVPTRLRRQEGGGGVMFW